MRKVRTLRGQITAVSGKAEKQLILNDQLINRGLRVTGFFVWPSIASATQDQNITAILSYARLGSADVEMNAGDNTQLGWAFQMQTGAIPSGGPPDPGRSPASSGYFNQLIDPDHIINRDLFISLRASNDRTYNYLVVCEFMALSDDEAIITIIKENSQSIE